MFEHHFIADNTASRPRIERPTCIYVVRVLSVFIAKKSDRLIHFVRRSEAQRIKIAAHLSSFGGERVLYILDEPTTGLHFDDIAKLLAAFRKLVEAGHTLLDIEHNLDVIKTADYVIDLGPEGGAAGGEVVATGKPEQIVQAEGSHTGRALRDVLATGRPNAYAAR